MGIVKVGSAAKNPTEPIIEQLDKGRAVLRSALVFGVPGQNQHLFFARKV